MALKVLRSGTPICRINNHGLFVPQCLNRIQGRKTYDELRTPMNVMVQNF